jgi:myo-inositol catabolism protein IolC
MPDPAPDRPLLILAFDHRTSLVRGLFRGNADAAARRAPIAKALVLDGLLEGLRDDPHAGRYRPGVLVDEQYGAPVAVAARAAGLVLCMAVERSGQAEVVLEYGAEAQAHLGRFAPDYVKALVRYNADDDPAALARQLDTLRALSADLRAAGRRLMFELLVPALPTQLDGVDGSAARYDAELRPALTIRAMREITAAGIVADLWKLEGLGDPADARAVAAQALAAQPPAPCLVLGRGADRAAVDGWLDVAAPIAGFGGFAIGRSIWWDAIAAWLSGEHSETQARAEIASAYRGFVSRYLAAA